MMYNPVTDNFTVYNPVEIPEVKLDLPLNDNPLDISNWASGITEDGVIIASPNIPEARQSLNNYSSEELIEVQKTPSTSEVTTESSSTKSASSTKVSEKASEKARYARSFFEKKGLTKHQAAGIVGNLMLESKLNTKAVGDSGTAYGIAQWRKDRKTKLENFAKLRGTSKDDLDTLLEFVWYELTSNTNWLKKLQATATVEGAAKQFMLDFERPNAKYAELSNRINFAHQSLL